MKGLALLQPGSTLWLLGHELRLNLRAVTMRKGGPLSLAILGIGLVVLGLFAGVPLALWLRGVAVRATSRLIMTFDLGLVVIFTLILSQTLASAVTAFYTRGDLDLLLASPLPPRRVLAVRAVGVALTPYLWFALLVTPVVTPMAILGQPRWLASYLILACVALLAASAGLSLAMALFRLIGARATRTVGQLLAAVIGAAFFLVSQSVNLFPNSGRSIVGGFERWSHGGAFEPAAPLAWPARAAMGEPLPLLAFVVVSLLIFTGVSAVLGRRFATDAALAAGVGSGPTRASRGPLEVDSFRGGIFVTLMRKELRLLIRDPTLLSQVLLRTLYVLPLTAVLARNASRDAVGPGGLSGVLALAAGAGAVTFMAGQVAGSLAWITISAEDAPELLACAPVDGGFVRRAKLAATMVPVVLLLALPLGALVVFAPWVGVCAIFGAGASAASAGLINLWFEKPARRSMSRRGGSVLGASAELLLGMGWAVAVAMAAFGSAFAVIPAAVTLVAMGVLYGFANPNRAY